MPNPLPVMTLFSTLLPAPPPMKARPSPDIGPLSTIRFPVITWFFEGIGVVPPSSATCTPKTWVAPVTVLFRRVTALLRSEEHTSELQSPVHLVCRLLLEKKK